MAEQMLLGTTSSMLAIVQKANTSAHICSRVAEYAVSLGILVASVTINNDVEMTPLAEHLPVSLHVRNLLA